MSLLLLLHGAQAGAVTVQPFATNLAIGLPALKIRTPSPVVPFLLDEAGAILLSEDGEPLIDESQTAKLALGLPALKARKVGNDDG